MKILFLFFFIFPISSFAQETINCFNNYCATSFTPQSIIEKPFYTSIDLGLNSNDINVTNEFGEVSRSVRIHLENKSNPRDLNINLSSTLEGSNSGNIYIIGDIVKNLNVFTNGYSGTKGKDASEICGEKASNGLYGIDIQNFYNNRRISNPNLPVNNCDQVDIDYMASDGFACDDLSFTNAPGQNPVVQVERIIKRASCSGLLVRNICYKPTATVSCRWQRTERFSTGQFGFFLNQTYSPVITATNQDFTTMNNLRNAEQYVNLCTIAGARDTWADGYNSFYRSVDIESGVDVTVSLSYPGLNNETFQPLPGSSWQSYLAGSYESCLPGWSVFREEVSSRIAYDQNDNQCDDISIPEDPQNLIEWVYIGDSQEPEFGTEILQCSPASCPVSNTISEFNHQIDTITPEAGANGSQQGSGKIFIYDVESINTQSENGSAGAAGLDDVPKASDIRYCFKKQDAGTSSDIGVARNPLVSFRKYNWNPIRTTGLGDGGTPPAESGKKIEVFKKVGPSVRFLLKNEIL